MPVVVLLFYFLVPVRRGDAPVGELLGVLIGFGCVVAVGVVIASEVRRSERRLRLSHLVLAFEIVLVAFALTYFLVVGSRPQEFSGMATRLDALYFSMATMSTVGFGDVNAQGQIARLLVTIQMLFDLVFVAALVALLQDNFKRGGGFSRGRT